MRGSMSRKIYALTGALAVTAAIFLAFASAAIAVPANFWGVVPQAAPTAPQLERLGRGGVDAIRIPISWPTVQASRDAGFDWSAIDREIEDSTRAGIEVFPFLTGAPAWAVPFAWVPGSGHSVKAPQNLPVSGAAASGWSGFVAAAAARYGSGGSFWAEHPTLTQRPIRVWQIWNEENFKYFVTRPNPTEYGKLVKLSYAALKGVDAGSKIVLGGMFAKPREATFKFKPPQAYFAANFLDKMYRTTPGVKSKFVGVALHPYTTTYLRLPEEVEAFRAVLRKHRDAGKGLWITELGWSSERPNPGDSFAKGPTGQVTQLKGAFGLFERRQIKWRLRQIFWFSVDDQPGSCNFCGGSGLFARGFVPKKSWFAYVKFAGGSAS